MAFNVNAFRTELTGDGARANLFDVNLQFPPIVTLGALASQKATFQVKAAQLPGSAIGVVPTYYFGRETKLAGNRQYQDWTVQVLNDEDFPIRNALEQWHSSLNGPATNLRAPGATVVDGGYGADAVVTQYDKAGNVLKQYNFVGIWPMDISPIEVDWQQNDAIEEFTCTFAVQYYMASSVDF